MAKTSTFGPWLERQLIRRDMIAADLARKLGVGNSTVTMWLRGERVPRPDSCRRVAEALYLDPDEVLVAAGHREPDIDRDPSSMAEQVATLVRRVNWTPDRFIGVSEMLSGWIALDREHNTIDDRDTQDT